VAQRQFRKPPDDGPGGLDIIELKARLPVAPPCYYEYRISGYFILQKEWHQA
jgi:hypothetical protein